jgi:hypothetical protein
LNKELNFSLNMIWLPAKPSGSYILSESSKAQYQDHLTAVLTDAAPEEGVNGPTQVQFQFTEEATPSGNFEYRVLGTLESTLRNALTSAS